MKPLLLVKIIAAPLFLWLSTLSYLAWFKPDRLVPPLWHRRNSGYDLWMARLVAPIGAVIILVILIA
jgi:hypothetical protein